MLRLSIIVPYRNDNARLEETLLSILENRPQNSELIVAHDGSYADPYALVDELTFMAFPKGTPLTAMLNGACEASNSPNVCTLLDGVVVTPGWADGPLEALEHEGADAVAVQVRHGHQRNFGISRTAIRRAEAIKRGAVELDSPKGRCGGPSLTCSFFNRDSLMALEGWSEELDPMVADIEMAQRLTDSEWEVMCAEEAVVHAREPRKYTVTASRHAAQLAAVYGLASSRGLNTAAELLVGCLTGRLSHSLAWLAGLRTGASQQLLQRKHAAAELRDDAEVLTGPRLMKQTDKPVQYRRAA